MAKKSITRHNEKCDHLDYLKTSASDTECTGVVYTGPLNDVELDNITMSMPLSRNRRKKRSLRKFLYPQKLSMLQFFYRKLFYLEFFYNH